MNEALELAGRLDDYARGDEYQRVTEEAAAMLRSQAAEIEGWKNDQKENLRNQCDLHAEIERLESSNESYITLANTAYEITDALRAENQKLRKALESVSNMSEELSISRYARAALGETK